jgi:hypothetical protein
MTTGKVSINLEALSTNPKGIAFGTFAATILDAAAKGNNVDIYCIN